MRDTPLLPVSISPVHTRAPDRRAANAPGDVGSISDHEHRAHRSSTCLGDGFSTTELSAHWSSARFGDGLSTPGHRPAAADRAPAPRGPQLRDLPAGVMYEIYRKLSSPEEACALRKIWLGQSRMRRSDYLEIRRAGVCQRYIQQLRDAELRPFLPGQSSQLRTSLESPSRQLASVIGTHVTICSHLAYINVGFIAWSFWVADALNWRVIVAALTLSVQAAMLCYNRSDEQRLTNLIADRMWPTIRDSLWDPAYSAGQRDVAAELAGQVRRIMPADQQACLLRPLGRSRLDVYAKDAVLCGMVIGFSYLTYVMPIFSGDSDFASNPKYNVLISVLAQLIFLSAPMALFVLVHWEPYSRQAADLRHWIASARRAAYQEGRLHQLARSEDAMVNVGLV